LRPETSPDPPSRIAGRRRALVLSGGGSRGAYEAGVLRFLFDELPKDLGRAAPIDIVTGTSVGAIHACFAAATAHLDEGRGERLRQVWAELDADVLFGSVTQELLQMPQRMLGLLRSPRSLKTDTPPERLFGLLNTEKLEKLVTHAIPWRKIRPNLREHRLRALSVAATEIATGRVVVFVDAEPPEPPPWTRDRSVVARGAAIGPRHALASAAIPALFPAVRVGSTYYADGGLRFNTPLAPALLLGADRVLVVALRGGPPEGATADLEAHRIEHFGNPLFLFGKVLDALLLDHIETDLAHMRLLNTVLRGVESAAGAEVLEAVNDAVRAERGHPFKVIEDLVIRPSHDLGLLAGDIAHGSSEGRGSSAAVRFLLKTLGFGGLPFEADLLSYLFFDARYTQPLMELGFEDARRLREPLVAFFSD
jgi:NTE family protein